MRTSVRPVVVLAVLCVLAALVGGALAGTGAGKQLRIGLVLDDINVKDPYERGAFLGLQRAINELGVAGKVVAPRTYGTYLPSFSYLARKH